MAAANPDSVPESARQAAKTEPAPEVLPAGSESHADDVHSSERLAASPEPQRPTSTLSEAGELLRALAAPVRIAIVLQLHSAERCVHELVDALGVSQPLISQHLRVLKTAGIVTGKRHGREVVYRLVDEHLAHIVVDAVAHAEETSETRVEGSTPLARDDGQETA
ncbi:ArsR family transcriptional regulator [Saccharopolyspora lacisalsi]|uniref:ArsR family transcriptional regulator n=1 Tax=Halosaccharopolyspora lacisalsi TaxID=1000566 RepID=A0A839DXK6_9PSEU|nr:metalloregulator ArsR/SmtB family transcription factor [Halosaccharopolyspora lacisalsi]MBA8825469.1 ArsR family transcriptional regulator [Halosaccharopolyspora lacisalsi]